MIYDVVEQFTFNGKVWRQGETIPQETILRVAPHKLGPLIRRGHIVPQTPEAPAAPAPAFGGMTKKALLGWAADNDVDIPDDVTKVADIRRFLKERTA